MGFADEHPVSTYHVLNMKAHTIGLMKNMTFLGKSYSKWNKVEKLTLVLVEMVSSNENNSNNHNDVCDLESDMKQKKSFLTTNGRKS